MKHPTAKIKTRGANPEKSKSARADSPTARAVGSREQTQFLLKNPSGHQDGFSTLLRLEPLSRGFRTPNRAKFKSNLGDFSIRTQRCNSRRQIPWHAFPEIKNVQNAYKTESNPRLKILLRFQYFF